MNTTYKTKFLFHLNQKKQSGKEEGFTLIELLVVVIIIGILAAIGLPSFLNQANKAKQAEGRQYVTAINRAQQMYYIENGTFVSTSDAAAWGSLAIGIRTQTANYKYSISAIGIEGASAFADASQMSKALKNYTGVVGLVAPVAGAPTTTQALICETKNAGETPTAGTVGATELQCPGNASPLK
ncbi:type IV pilin-like G/H family protein [Aerosakkonemataceae cyanobacterium BLCC-F154]|uniref:Type IV pilin-like G/H family protein n=1 Tax=Floridaenema fluviatile BLCC-F154 TaxID=3153640 RepID=A0ABV4Y9X1_9CYAN